MSFSKKNVIRGLHIQTKNPQGKYISVIKGKIYDVSIDLRKNSKNFGKYYSCIPLRVVFNWDLSLCFSWEGSIEGVRTFGFALLAQLQRPTGRLSCFWQYFSKSRAERLILCLDCGEAVNIRWRSEFFRKNGQRHVFGIDLGIVFSVEMCFHGRQDILLNLNWK